MDHYRLAATGEFPKSMEVYQDETPWTVPEIHRYSITVPHSGPTVQPRIVCAEFFSLGRCASRFYQVLLKILSGAPRDSIRCASRFYQVRSRFYQVLLEILSGAPRDSFMCASRLSGAPRDSISCALRLHQVRRERIRWYFKMFNECARKFSIIYSIYNNIKLWHYMSVFLLSICVTIAQICIALIF